MDTRVRATMATLQAFKLSANAEKEAEPPVLDLSCKKQQSCKKEETSAPLCSEDNSNLRASSSSNGKQQETTNRFSTYENKSLFEVCACMVTPPSSGGETDSPKKRKYNRTNVVGKERIDHNANPVMPACLPMSVVPTILPALVRQNVSNKPDQLSATSSVQRDVEAPTSLSSEPSNKVLRPFKAYPKNPMSLSMGAAEIMYDQSSIEAYSKFRDRMLESVRKTNEGPNIRMRRVMRNSSSPTSTVDEKNAAYLERRKKNNEAAKRSRDARRAKEDEIAIRAAFLEQENMQLKYEIVALREETAKLRHMVFGS